jgi:CheY-like chemotaxis protein
MSDAVLTGPIRVLVVEDSEDQSALLRQNFERAGCRVTTAANAEQAIAAYLADPPELAVIDLVLPGMDGWELVARVRADLPNCAIAITSVLDAADFPAAEAILPKPFTGAEIREVLKNTVPRWEP